MKKFIIGVITFLSISFLTAGLIYIYMEYYPVEESAETVKKNTEFKDTDVIAKEEGNTETELESEVESPMDIEEEETDEEIEEVEETEDSKVTKETETMEEQENQEVIVETSNRLNRSIRELNKDRINTYEDYVPTVRLNQLNDSLIGADIKVVGEIMSQQDTDEGEVLLISDKDSILKVENREDYSYNEIGDVITLSGVLRSEKNEFIIYTDRTDYIEENYRETLSSLTSAYGDTAFGGIIVEKTVLPQGHIELKIQDNELKMVEVFIPNTLNPISSNYKIDDFIIVNFNMTNYKNNSLTIKTLSDIEKRVKDDYKTMNSFIVYDMSIENIGKYGVIESKISDYHIFPDNTVYLVLESDGIYYHGIILKEKDGMSYEIQEMLQVIEETVQEDKSINFFGMINQYDDQEEFIILDVFEY